MQHCEKYIANSNESDKILLSQYENGSQQALTALIAKYASLINKRAFCYNIPGVEIDDIKQEAYMGLFSAIRTFSNDKNASFYTYANFCINNRLNNMFAAASSKKAKFNQISISLNDIDECVVLNAKSLNPEAIFFESEDYKLLLNLLENNLSKYEKDILFMYLNGCSYDIIANKLNSSQKSIDNALQRARRKLKKVLNQL